MLKIIILIVAAAVFAWYLHLALTGEPITVLLYEIF